MADPRDAKGAHAREFTNHELLTLRTWFDLDLAGNDVLAQQLLDAGLMLEHYTSLLDNEVGKRTIDELQNQQQLTFAFLQVLNEANAFLLTRKTGVVNTWQGWFPGRVQALQQELKRLSNEVKSRGQG
jgi:hypothetical protein